MAELEGLWYALLLCEGPSWRRRGGAREPRRCVRGEDRVGDGDWEGVGVRWRVLPFLCVERGGGVGERERRRLCFRWGLGLPSLSLSARDDLCLESRRSRERLLRGLSFDLLAGDLDLGLSGLVFPLCSRDLCSSRSLLLSCFRRLLLPSSPSSVLLLFRSLPSSRSRCRSSSSILRKRSVRSDSSFRFSAALWVSASRTRFFRNRVFGLSTLPFARLGAVVDAYFAEDARASSVRRRARAASSRSLTEVGGMAFRLLDLTISYM